MGSAALSVAITVILQASPPDPYLRAPDRLTEALTTIAIDVEFLGNCLDQGGGDQTDPRFAQLDRRYWATRREVIRIWGSAEDDAAISEHFFTEAFFPEKRRRCRKAQIQTALDNANAKLAEIEQSLSLAAVHQRTGAWTGALRLCRDTVSRTEMVMTEWGGEPALRVTLTSRGRSALFDLTGRAVGKTLAVRIDGRVVFEPHISEPLQSDTVHIQADDPQTLERIRALVADGC